MRSSSGIAANAPVDGQGCAAAGAVESDPRRKRFAVLISLMLSSQTKGWSSFTSLRKKREQGLMRGASQDEMTDRAVKLLRSTLPDGLTPSSLFEASDELVKSCISCVCVPSSFLASNGSLALIPMDGRDQRLCEQEDNLPQRSGSGLFGETWRGHSRDAGRTDGTEGGWAEGSFSIFYIRPL